MDSALAKRMAQQAAKAAGDGSDDDDDDDVQACDNYRVDLQAKNFGDCKCGFPKFSHKEKPKPVGRAAFQKKEQQAEEAQFWKNKKAADDAAAKQAEADALQAQIAAMEAELAAAATAESDAPAAESPADCTADGYTYTALTCFAGNVPCDSGLSKLTTYESYTRELPAMLVGKHWFYGSFEVYSDNTVRLAMYGERAFDLNGLEILDIQIVSRDDIEVPFSDTPQFTIRGSNGYEVSATAEYEYPHYKIDDDHLPMSKTTTWSDEFKGVTWVDFISVNTKPKFKNLEYSICA